MPDTCKDCKHWCPVRLNHELATKEVLSQRRGKCEMADSDYADHHGAHKDEVEPKYFGVEVHGGDNWGVDWELVTGPDFGCVKFEPRVPRT